MTYENHTNAELIDLVESGKHRRMSELQLERLVAELDRRLGELRYGY